MKQQFKRILSVFLIFAMVVSFFPMQLKAADLEEDLPADDSSQEVEAIEPEQDATDSVDVQRGNVAFTTLSGTVVDASGNGMQGVSVVLYNYDENMLLPQCFTDSNGAWSSVEFDVLVGYTYLMSFYKAGYQFSANNFEVIAADGGTTVQTVTATALDIPGLICKENDYTYTISSEKATITKYTGSDTAIILPEKLGGYPVTAVGASAFQNNKTLQTVLCSGAITTLGEHAFTGCVSLATVTLPNALTVIHRWAFDGCTALESIVLPDSITTIGYRAFANCIKLASINFPRSWSTVYTYGSYGGDIFNGCTKLTSITVPESVAVIPDYAFEDCNYLQTASLPSTLTSIGKNAFSGCTALNNVDVPAGTTSLDEHAFSGCTSLDKITLPDGLTVIHRWAFDGCTALESIVLPDSVTTIGYRAFANCTKLASINFPRSWSTVYTYGSYGGDIFNGCVKLTSLSVPEGVTAIPNYAFEDCNYLKTVILPSTLLTIGASAFSGCASFVRFTVPDGVKTIGNSAFSNCKNLVRIWIPESVSQISNSAFSNRNANFTIHGVSGSYAETYANANSIPFSTEKISYDLTGIGGAVSGDILADVSVSIYDKTERKYIAYDVRTDIEGLWSEEDVTVGNVYIIRFYKAGYEFSDNNLEVTAESGSTEVPTVTATALNIPGLVCKEGDYTYTISSEKATITKYTGSDTAIILPEKLGGYPVTVVGASAFQNNKTLQTVLCSGAITTLGEHAFTGCVSLATVTLPNALTVIHRWAFDGCTALESIVLPDSITTIGYRAFANCIKLASINFPRSWSTVYTYGSYGGDIFNGCTKLTSITVPESVAVIPDYAFEDCNYLQTASLPSTLTSIGKNAFSGCTALNNVDVPAGTTSLDEHAFSGCTSLDKITLPDGLTVIHRWAFDGCTALESIVLPDSVTTIGYRAFANCTKLASINFPRSWSTVYTYGSYGGDIFNGCVKLTSLSVPEGVTAIPNYAFEDCNYLKTVILPSTLLSIGAHAFSGCSNLRYIAVPYAITSIGDNAFSNCGRLRLLYMPTSRDVDLGSNIFSGCGKLTVECEEYSFVTVYCIKQGISVQFISSNLHNTESLRLSREATYYMANTVGAMSNGYITMNLAYAYKSGVSGITKQTLELYLPDNATLIEKTLRLNGKVLSGYDLENNVLTISLQETSGRLSFNLQPTGDKTLTSYAIMDFTENGTAKREIIGIINENIPILSIFANETTDSAQFTVTGVGPADANIDIYIDSAKAATAHSTKGGSYSASVTLPSASDYTTYTVSAKAQTKDGIAVSAATSILYCSGSPELKAFTMKYSGNTYDVLKLGTAKPAVTFTPGTAFSFDAKFSNAEKIDKVYVCSTRSNVTKRIEAKWNEATQTYQATGLFDPSNPSYIPGTITVQYSQAKTPIQFSGTIDYGAARYVNGASTPIKNVLNGKLHDCIEDLVSTDKQLSGIIKMVDVDAQLDFNILTDIIPSYLDPSNAGQYGYEVMEDDYGAKLYLKVAEYGEDKVRGEIIDFTKDKLTTFLIDGKHISAAENIDSYFSFVEVLGYADKLITWDNNRVSLEDARQAVLASSMGEAEKAAALKRLETASKANNGVVAAMGLSIILTAAGITLPFPCGLILPLLSMQNSSYVESILGEFGFLSASESAGAAFSFRWKIDPSGYVYDVSDNSRLSGVTATAYWIEYTDADSDDSFWDHAPSSTEYGTKWDASDWDEINPLTTDANGAYSWDVPKGWWRVKYEKEGYDTVWSDWMPVPPVQENVNIGMTASTVIEKYALDAVSSSATSTTVTLTNNTASSVSVQYILAAYTADGQMVASSTVASDLQSQKSIKLTVQYSAKDQVSWVSAFVLQAGTLQPLRAVWKKAL